MVSPPPRPALSTNAMGYKAWITLNDNIAFYPTYNWIQIQQICPMQINMTACRGVCVCVCVCVTNATKPEGLYPIT